MDISWYTLPLKLGGLVLPSPAFGRKGLVSLEESSGVKSWGVGLG